MNKKKNLQMDMLSKNRRLRNASKIITTTAAATLLLALSTVASFRSPNTDFRQPSQGYH